MNENDLIFFFSLILLKNIRKGIVFGGESEGT